MSILDLVLLRHAKSGPQLYLIRTRFRNAFSTPNLATARIMLETSKSLKWIANLVQNYLETASLESGNDLLKSPELLPQKSVNWFPLFIDLKSCI